MSNRWTLGALFLVVSAVASTAVLPGDETLQGPSKSVGYSISAVPTSAETQVLYIVDSQSGVIAVYDFSVSRRTLKLSSVMRLDGRAGGVPMASPVVLEVLKAGPGTAILYVVDTSAGKLTVYRHNLSTGSLTLEAARDWTLDMKLDFFNAGPEGRELTPEIIRQSLPSQ